MPVFSLDGTSYQVGVKQIDRDFSILEGSNSLTAKSGAKIRDIIGTEYSYTVHIDMREISPEDYDSLYTALSAPVASHAVVMPFGQSTLAFQACITGGSDTLKRFTAVRKWGELTFTLTPLKPQVAPESGQEEEN